MEQDSFSSPGTIQTIIFVAILITLFIVVCTLFAPFLTVLLWSILLYTLLAPLHQRLTRGMNFSKTPGLLLKNLIAAVFSMGTMVLIIVPLCFVIFRFYLQIVELVRALRDFITGNPEFINDMSEKIAVFIDEFSGGLITPAAADIRRDVMQSIVSGTQNIIAVASSLARNVGAFAVSLAFMFFCLFFFFLDAPYLSALVMHIIPIKKEHMNALVGKFKETTRNLFLGYIMVSLFQALVAYVIFSVFRVKGSLVLAALVLICSFIPMFGAGLIWGPIGIFRIITGDLAGGIVFLAVSGIGISLLDNFLRPFFLQNRIHLHPLIIFVSILGGVTVYGFNGLILGPLMVILFLTVLDMFLAEHHFNTDQETQ